MIVCFRIFVKRIRRFAVFELAVAQICFTGVAIIYGGILVRVAALECAKYVTRRQAECHEKK